MAFDKVRLYKECIPLQHSELLIYLKSEYGDSLERLVNSNGDDFKLLQGESRRLKELIDLINGAKEALAYVEKNRARKAERLSNIPNP